MKKLTLHIICPCGVVKQVKTRWHQARQKYCSRSCAQKIAGCPREARARGGRTRASRERLNLMKSLSDKTPIEAFRMGYDRGLQSKWRQMRKHRQAAA